jgi:cytochrome c
MTRIVVALLAFALAGCGAPHEPGPARPQAIGDVERGRLLLRQYGCSGCHRIPGVAGAPGDTGPPLDALARRVYLAGLLPNTPQALAHWIQQPQALSPGTAMPDMQVAPAQARDMAAYLYSLR